MNNLSILSSQDVRELLDEYRHLLPVAGLLAGLALGYRFGRHSNSTGPRVIKAPVPATSNGYPSDYYDGGKQVATPYGDIRVYEFGPADGERLLFVHGISTPSPVFSKVIDRLQSLGKYRVALFDLFGRGYTDSPDVPHDDRLYVTQLLIVLRHLGWDRCSLVGYSLGGGIVADFASYFPQSIDKVVMIAPAGLLVESSLPAVRRIAKSPHVPLAVVSALQGLVRPRAHETKVQVGGDRRDLARVIDFQDRQHKGFLRSYLSTYRNAVIFDRWDVFERLARTELHAGDRCRAIWGSRDDIVDTQVVSANLVKALPACEVVIIDDVAHDVAASRPDDLADRIHAFLKGTTKQAK
ncbi:hypothetical protein PYCC9005_001014 [Savitreella phatthalungensis]